VNSRFFGNLVKPPFDLFSLQAAEYKRQIKFKTMSHFASENAKLEIE
jgi:hypothetical protein